MVYPVVKKNVGPLNIIFVDFPQEDRPTSFAFGRQSEMPESKRSIAREIARRQLAKGDPLGWFEKLYAAAAGDPGVIPWADLAANPNLVSWLDAHRPVGRGRSALKVGCGLGDDAEELGQRGYKTTEFDISPTAIAWCGERFPGTAVDYQVHDLFEAPKSWQGRFDLVVESYTLQVLPAQLRPMAIKAIAGFVKPAGTLLVISRGRRPAEAQGKMPWPLTRRELDGFLFHGLTQIVFEDYMDEEDPPVRRFRVTYEKTSARPAPAGR